MEYKTRPLSSLLWTRPDERTRSPFSASWAKTLDLLGIEMRALDAENIVIEVDVTEAQIRVDGMLRARAIAESPAVRLSFESPSTGALMFECDTYAQGPAYRNAMQPWQHNVRAIAMTMADLRGAARHRVIRGAEQYAGFKAIEAGASAARVREDDLPVPEATAVLLSHFPLMEGWPMSVDGRRSLVRRARSATHPDHGGDVEEFGKVNHAVASLERAGFLP